jgi:hypothetical protein
MLATPIALFLSLLFSIGPFQSAQLNVLAVPTSVSGPATTRSAPGICDVTLSFFDGQSNLLKTEEVWINPGGSATLGLPLPQQQSRGPALFYGEVTLNGDSDSSCQLLPDLEVSNQNGGGAKVLVPLSRGGLPQFNNLSQ